ncbi:MAG: TRAP transporter small permease [Rubrivivax sp.]|nr:TRAP transporter small permease [Rubrivivax sp.]
MRVQAPAAAGGGRRRAWAALLARRIERTLDVLLGAAIGVMVVAMAWQVIGRYAFSRAPGWTEEASRFLMLWVTMLGAAAALRSGSHIAVTSLVDVLGPRARAVTLALRDAALVAVAGLLAWQGFLYARLNGAQESAALEIPMTVPYAALPAGGVLIVAMVLLARLLGSPFPTQAVNEGEGVF